MEIIFDSQTPHKPKASFILLDWSCRESFHFLNYINQQTVPRETYEVIWIEYYDRRSPEIRTELEKSEQSGRHPWVDKWIAMDMPKSLYYHKHLMYNIGIVLSKGEIVTICDSDAIVQKDFVETIIKSFETNPNIILHMDEVRNNDQKFHPFNYPEIEAVIGEGAINYKDGTTVGLLDEEDPLHSRNYGACMCAKREDLIAIGGADEHMDYLGHVCGPYELTFRLRNIKRLETWHPDHLLYHVWHPGQAGDGNYVGPHDGQHISSTALSVLESGRVQPLLENQAIQYLRENKNEPQEILADKLIREEYFADWTHEAVSKSTGLYLWHTAQLLESVDDINIVLHNDIYYGLPQILGAVDLNKEEGRNHPEVLSAKSVKKLKKLITKNKKELKQQTRNPDGSPMPARLLETVDDINIVLYNNIYYGLPHRVGAIDVSKEEERNHPDIFSANSSKRLKKLITQSKKESKKQQPLNFDNPTLIEVYKQYNLVGFKSEIYACRQSLGVIDLTNESQRNNPEILKADTLEKLKRLTNKKSQPDFSDYLFPRLRKYLGPEIYTFLSKSRKLLKGEHK